MKARISLRKFLSYVLVAAFAIQSAGSPAFSDGLVRTDRRFGVGASFAGSPAPAGLGVDLRYNLTSFLRLEAGTGFYNDWLGPNLGRAGYNYIMRPIGYAVVIVIVGLLETIFYYPFTGHYSLPGYFPEAPYSNGKQVTSYGFGGDFLLPGFRLSPFGGLHWATYTSQGLAYGIKDGTSAHTYYDAGLDWQSPSGWDVGVGKNFCPSLPSGACGYFLNIGLFF